ncbi:hypothetical protein NCS55_00926000 [Fusarium keratoplasticum]|nr:hypothetical protein NCS55_00926000 [Fusarium keratoplasticum]
MSNEGIQLDLIRAKAFKKPPKGSILDNPGGPGVLVDLCYKSEKDHSRFIWTPFIARDMLFIVEALDQGHKINHWDTSYGSVLGYVFFAMFPDHVGRFVLEHAMHVNC